MKQFVRSPRSPWDVCFEADESKICVLLPMQTEEKKALTMSLRFRECGDPPHSQVLLKDIISK